MSQPFPAPTADHKRRHGQFYTVGNPFTLVPFRQWFQAITRAPDQALLEPFAGAGHIPRLLRAAGVHGPWACFDLDPQPDAQPGPFITRRDTLANFPAGFSIAITNPPYLARNSAARRGLPYPETTFDDLYKHALDVALTHVPYLAAIIPESFITAGLFHHRLSATVSLACPMFDDTEHPVCLALFVPETEVRPEGFELWDADTRLGRYPDFAQILAPATPQHRIAWRFNDPEGVIGLRGVDNQHAPSIRFVAGTEIPATEIKVSSRALTRISGVPEDIDPVALIDNLNHALADYRLRTHDVMMTSFKGLRRDGKYRRRLDFAAARHLLDHAVYQLRGIA